jgi:hypothetical protein
MTGCTLCELGYFTKQTSSAECKPCPPDFYAYDIGSVTCVSMPPTNQPSSEPTTQPSSVPTQQPTGFTFDLTLFNITGTNYPKIVVSNDGSKAVAIFNAIKSSESETLFLSLSKNYGANYSLRIPMYDYNPDGFPIVAYGSDMAASEDVEVQVIAVCK